MCTIVPVLAACANVHVHRHVSDTWTRWGRRWCCRCGCSMCAKDLPGWQRRLPAHVYSKCAAAGYVWCGWSYVRHSITARPCTFLLQQAPHGSSTVLLHHAGVWPLLVDPQLWRICMTTAASAHRHGAESAHYNRQRPVEMGRVSHAPRNRRLPRCLEAASTLPAQILNRHVD